LSSTFGALLRHAIAAPLRALIAGLRALSLRGRPVLAVALGQERGRADGPADPEEATAMLEAIADDDRIRAVLLDLRGLAGGRAVAQDLRAALLRLRQRGRLVVTHLDSASLTELSIAAAGDRVWLTPSGDVFLTGIGVTQHFLADALALVGAKAQIMSAGAYKSFGERATRNHPSVAHREALGHLLAGLQSDVLQSIADDRKQPVAAVAGLLAASPLPPQRLVDAGLIDGLAYPDEVDAELGRLLDAPTRARSLRWWWRLSRWDRGLRGWAAGAGRVEVVHLHGPVVQAGEALGGRGPRIDADEVVPLLDQLREDDDVRAVVLSINSPGGSVLASDLIARAVRRLGDKRPTVAIFGDVAASGGYYIAAPCAEIIARPSTITGSIGVVGGKIVLRDALTRWGVHPELVAAGPDADLLSPFFGWDRDQAERFRASLLRHYDRFLAVVAAGRGRPVEQIEPFAQGRVWTGRQALENGLVDRLGDLSVALARARLLSGLPVDGGEIRHRWMPRPRLPLLRVILGGGSAEGGLGALVAGLGLGSAGLVAAHLWGRPLEPMAIAPLDLPEAWGR
jgi:protease-4